MKDIRGKDYPMKQHEGQVCLIMNVASACGYTADGYNTANALYDKYNNRGFTVLAFPCNQFGSQESGTNAEIENFACGIKKSKFPIMDKVEVNGANAHGLWEAMKTTKPGILGTTSIKWNFTKFLVGRDGMTMFRYGPGDKLADIEKDLLTIL